MGGGLHSEALPSWAESSVRSSSCGDGGVLAVGGGGAGPGPKLKERVERFMANFFPPADRRAKTSRTVEDTSVRRLYTTFPERKARMRCFQTSVTLRDDSVANLTRGVQQHVLVETVRKVTLDPLIWFHISSFFFVEVLPATLRRDYDKNLWIPTSLFEHSVRRLGASP